MREHVIDQLVIGPFWVIEAELVKGRAFLPEKRTNRNAHGLDELDQLFAGRRRLQIFDDSRIDPALPDHRKRVTRRAAIGVVIDRELIGLSLRLEWVRAPGAVRAANSLAAC